MNMQAKHRIGGWIPEPEKPWHWNASLLKSRYSYELKDKRILESEIDIHSPILPVFNQGNVGSCVACATCRALEIKYTQRYQRPLDLSRMALYFLAREMEPTEVMEDNGTHISYACDAARRFGIPEAPMWPYYSQHVNVAPPWRVMRDAWKNKIQSFYRISSTGADRVTDVLIHLHAGNPVIFGMLAGEDLLDYRAGQILGPVQGRVVGGHAMLIVGWTGTAFIIENSWGVSWGSNGFAIASTKLIESRTTEDYWVAVTE